MCQKWVAQDIPHKYVWWLGLRVTRWALLAVRDHRWLWRACSGLAWGSGRVPGPAEALGPRAVCP